MYVNRCCSFRREKCDQERSQKVSEIHRPYKRNIAHVECNKKSDNSNKRDNWYHNQNIQKVPQQHTGMHKMKRLQKTAIFGYCTHVLETTNVK